MSFRFSPLAAALLAAAATSTPVFAQNEPPEGFIALFNGKDLSGWHGQRHFDPYKLESMKAEDREKLLAEDATSVEQHWKVEDGEIVNDGHGAYLTSDKEFGDIELWIDYKTVPRADSGIYLRGTPQVQIWDYTDEGKFNIGADKGSGGLWNNSAGAPGKDPSVLADRPFGEWNTFRIVQIGPRTSVWLNGKLVVYDAVMENYWDREKPLRGRGPIQLQTHGGEIRWRNIFVREISDEEAIRAHQAARVYDGFESIFDGFTFRGWKEPQHPERNPDGEVRSYMIEGGAMMCKPRSGSTLHTEEIYGDFTVRFEFNLPPRGNNGLAIRYPTDEERWALPGNLRGSTDTAYIGMCELQILEAGYDGIAPYQAHGSAYGMVPALTGYLRPPGEWNFQEVTVKGSTIKVELNGAVILDCDLATLEEPLADGKRRSEHPGMNRTKGHFGFAGHGDPVKFRNVWIKRLD